MTEIAIYFSWENGETISFSESSEFRKESVITANDVLVNPFLEAARKINVPIDRYGISIINNNDLFKICEIVEESIMSISKIDLLDKEHLSKQESIFNDAELVAAIKENGASNYHIFIRSMCFALKAKFELSNSIYIYGV